ncbi:vacJ-like lipoprotein precursor [alpha proteobacterium U9-1i]|nr:vacJ-like lipoprotein precursor [alpha proteobacterium U9-1i]
MAAPVNARAQDTVYDPWEGANRNLFAAHEAIDQALLEPIARGYRAVTNQPVRKSVVNFVRNLRAPVIFANDVLQGEVERAGVTAARFGVNSTVGLLGLFDTADEFGLEYHDEDFGQTLAVWGVGDGPYLFVPLMGPTNLRDGAGRIVDTAFNPLTWAEFDGDDTFRTTNTTATVLATREGLLDTVDAIRSDSLDPYVTFRSSYDLLRSSAIENGRSSVQDLPDFEDIPEASDEAAPEAAPEPDGGGDVLQPTDQPVPPPSTATTDGTVVDVVR